MKDYVESPNHKLDSDSGASAPPANTTDGDVTPATPSQDHTAAPRQKAPRGKKAKPRSADKLGSQGAPDSKDQQPSEDAARDNGAKFAEGLTAQICKVAIRYGKRDQRLIDFIGSVIEGIKPKDQLEMMSAALAAVVHDSAMTSAAKLNNSATLEQVNTHQNGLYKGARTFTAMLEGLKRSRSTNEPTINVAIVGNVNGQSAPTKTSDPPLALTDAKTVEMPIIQDNDRSAVSATPSLKQEK